MIKRQATGNEKQRLRVLGLFLAAIIFCLPSLVAKVGLAQDLAVLAPPIVNFYNKNISNDELFYVSGGSIVPGAEVVIYIQKENGSMLNKIVKADAQGRWFYSHPEFLNKGKYIIWSQLKINDLISPPSPQINIEVEATAVQVGDVRIGFDTLSAILAAGLGAMVFLLLIWIFYHSRQHRHQHGLLQKEIAQAEAFVHYGFISLRKDILTELNAIRKSGGDAEKEAKILRDLEIAERHINQEFTKIESLES